ncbi:hypothetical protein ABZZ36_38880 [Actinacidiphila glaucinigra]|uniref:hypothetical protein n=1 Tax=Actinacidiphila glaucinigra TaxID=235986 RepID=UPI0033A85EF3
MDPAWMRAGLVLVGLVIVRIGVSGRVGSWCSILLGFQLAVLRLITRGPTVAARVAGAARGRGVAGTPLSGLLLKNRIVDGQVDAFAVQIT